MRVLGISAHYHDSAAALLVDGEPVCAVQEERLSRRKNDAGFPLSAIEWCLEQGRLEPDQLDAVVFYEKPMLKFERILTMALRGFPRTWRSFPRTEGEYKVMGLGAYGKPTYEGLLKRIARRTRDGGVALDLSWFDFHQSARHSYSRKLVAELGPPREPWDPIDLQSADGRRYADVAASVQRVLEEILVDLARRLQRETGLQDLCLGGGVALNGVANARILRESGFRNVYVPSAPGDAGCALGAALYADRIHFARPHRPVADHAYWGPIADAGELSRVAGEDGFQPMRLPEAELIRRVADELARGRIVGWMQGACELGPRALGNRSILAAPHQHVMRDRLNRSIKYREEVRPFAPAVPLEHADRYFELPPGGARLARLMSGVFPVRPEWHDKLAAVTHADRTARPRNVDQAMAPAFHALLEAYGARTGIPVLLNTSFNLAGEPIVNRAIEGYSTFRRSGIDLLVAGDSLVVKDHSAQALPEVA